MMMLRIRPLSPRNWTLSPIAPWSVTYTAGATQHQANATAVSVFTDNSVNTHSPARTSVTTEEYVSQTTHVYAHHK